MKPPKEPVRPNKPYKPKEPDCYLPNKQMSARISDGDSLSNVLKVVGKVNVNTAWFEIRLNYDDTTETIISWEIKEKTKDPDYPSKLLKHKDKLVKYENEILKYKKDMEVYETKQKEYKSLQTQWLRWFHEDQLRKLGE